MAKTSRIRLRATMPSSLILAKLGNNPHLPSPPAVALQIIEKASRPDCTISQIAKLIRHDPGLTVKILKLVNSALFTLSQKISSVDRALTILGLNRVRSLVLSLSLPAMQRRTPAGPRMQEYWKTSVAGAIAARQLALHMRCPDPENEMVAGLLRDLGTLVLHEASPEDYAPVLAYSADQLSRSQCEVETKTLGVHHAQVSAFILDKWGLPEEMSQAIRFHHHPAEAAGLSSAVSDRAWLLYFSHLVGQLQATPFQPALVEEITVVAEKRFGWNKNNLESFLEPLNSQISELANLLELDLGPCHQYSLLLANATDQLTRLAVETSLDNFRVHQEKDQAVQEKEVAQEALHRVEEQLRQAQKMDAIGRLAGGMAHDFNNLLTVINGYSELLMAQLQGDSGPRSCVEEIRKAGERATALTRQLLAFSRKEAPNRTNLQVNEIVADMEKMLHRLIGEDIQLDTRLNPNLRSITADAGQMEQVIMNLVVNARDAMPNGGKLTIETSNIDLDETTCGSNAALQPGPFMLLTVSDTGHGMDDNTKSHLFEPFFTTKDPGKGTGLGLATVYGVVKQSNGHLLVQSELGKGTSFRIYLPQALETVQQISPKVVQAPIPAGNRTILLAEDDMAVRLIAGRVLETNGYTVLSACDGEEALALGGRHTGPIHLLITDTIMPRLGGPELAKKMMMAHPESRVLFMSGYTDDVIARHGGLQPGASFLQKPFVPQALIVKVREVLGSSIPN